MLRRMYLKWSDGKKFKSHLISEHKGEEAGIKSSTIKIEGDYVFGWLKKSQVFIDWLEFHHSTLAQETYKLCKYLGISCYR